MSSNSGTNTRVSIPGTVRKMIQDIKEISGNHSDEDVYAMLKQCSMDPNETAQRLLFLDTFHEVKRKRDKRKESVNDRAFGSSRQKPGNQGRGAISDRRSFSSQYASHDAGGKRVTAVRKETASEDNRGRGLTSPARSVLKETKTFPLTSNTAVSVKGPTCLPIDGMDDGHVVQHFETVDTVPSIHVRDADLIKPESAIVESKLNAQHVTSADPALAPMHSHDSQLPTAVGAIKSEVESHGIAAELKGSVIAERDLCYSYEFADQTQTNQHGSGKVEASGVSSFRSKKSEHINLVQPKMNGDSERLSFSPVTDTASGVQSSLLYAAGSAKAVEKVTTKLDKLKFAEGQHVILPDHIQVPDAVKNVLSFGSLPARFGLGVTDINSSVSNRNSNQASELLKDESSNEPECEEGTPSTGEEENYPDCSQVPSHGPDTDSTPENNVQSPKDDGMKQEAMAALVPPPYPIVQTTNYAFGFMPPLICSPLVQSEWFDQQAQLLNSVIGYSLAMSMSAPIPPSAQSAGAVQSSVAVSAQSLPLIHQPYPPNFLPSTHYFPPYFMPPTLPFLGHGSFPSQLPTGNMYLPAPTAASGMKIPLPYGPGTNLLNQSPAEVPSSTFVVSSSPQVVSKPGALVTSGSHNTNGDLVHSALKENNVCLGQQSESSTVWIPAPGRDSTIMPVNSFFSLPPQSQHFTISPQTGHGAFSRVYASTDAQPLVQQSEPTAGPVESAVPLPPSHSFLHPPQRQQINGNSIV